MYARFIESIHELDAASWNRLCPPDYPFVRHEFLAALENSQCTSANNGWQVQHLLIYSQDDLVNAQLLAIVPGYIKTHSYGEYVFDWSWADAYRRYGYAYYPKWINAIPFTPCVGPRVLCHTDIAQTQLLDFVVQTLHAKCSAENLSGWHSLFPDNNTSAGFTSGLASITRRLGCQFHWFNRDYRNFDDFVATMSSRKRKNILKERRQVLQQGFEFEVKTADQLTAQDWDVFYALYRNTYLKRSGHTGYLNAEFFQQLGATMSSNLVLINASVDQENGARNVIAASLFVRDQNTLYGRYWGCFEEYQFLHFETCYYQGIDYAIANGLTRFDGGAQGEHKIARGFEPVITYSHHWLKAPQFRNAIDQFIAEEALAIQHYADEVRDALPFKQREEQ
ncbi:GNAT family N-acetyltransferase [Cellvibrio sp. NN19]|uniref:GNAT family N-acetyltransferase n=1 Tax=Cellvibrio chitinivorans TaxID=3102792 RepID=UPI003A5CC946